MKFTVIAKAQFSVEWPRIEVTVNGNICGTAEIQDVAEIDFDIDLNQAYNTIAIRYINKQQHHTVFENGAIVQDQTLELQQVRLNDILLDNWFLTQGHYYPNYFEGFLQQCPDAERKLRSQLIWHFPGEFVFESVPSEDKFWFWYRDQRRYIHVKQYSDKEGYREENYIGSFDPLTDLMNDIRKIIDV